MDLIKSKIRTIPNFPKAGIMFRDITTLLADAKGFGEVIDNLVSKYKNVDIDYVAGIESRGFIIGGALAKELGVGFIPIRKKGKLPAKVISEKYALEYGTDTIEIHEDALKKGDKVLLIDDLIATGGTALAAVKLIEKVGGEVVSCAFVIDLPELGGKAKLAPRDVYTIVEFEGE
ncbi:MAG: adenine phosphoribosyltransferase [archaeon]|jgi:adenine phosphoribosyltransferase